MFKSNTTSGIRKAIPKTMQAQQEGKVGVDVLEVGHPALSEAEQHGNGLRQDDIGDNHAADEHRGRDADEDQRPLLLFGQQARDDERPELVQPDGCGDECPGERGLSRPR